MLQADAVLEIELGFGETKIGNDLNAGQASARLHLRVR
jgi:hypothetical protein